MTTIINGDCLDVIRGMGDNSIDAIVTDAPYGLSNTTPDKVTETIVRWAQGDREYVPATKHGFMGQEWDTFVPPPAVWDECFRVLKPGGHMAVFSGTRTQDLMGIGIRLAGFTVRDSLAWIAGSGFPKSHDVGKSTGDPKWAGFGTALKPAVEPILLARKPLSEKTVAANVLEHGTGAINVDATRIGPQETTGRFPANVTLDPVAARLLDLQSGNTRSPSTYIRGVSTKANVYGAGMGDHPQDEVVRGYADEGGASRFFHVAEALDGLDAPFMYCAKAPKKERPAYEGEDGQIIQHSTVKPLKLISWICRLIVPPGGTVLDPFAGSGTTVEAALLEGFNPVGIEAHAPYIRLIEQRVERAQGRHDAA